MPRDVARRILPADPVAAMHAATRQYAEKVKVSANDTTAGYLNGKLVAGQGIALKEQSDGGNETLKISSAGSAISWSTTLTQESGVTKSDDGGLYCHRFTTKVYISQPLRVQYLHVDFPGAGEYSVHINTHAVNSGVDTVYRVKTIAASVVITEEEAETTFGANKKVEPDDGEFVLLPGCYFFALESEDVDEVTWDAHELRWAYNPDYIRIIYPLSCALWSTATEHSWFNEKVSLDKCIPMRITAYKGTVVIP